MIDLRDDLAACGLRLGIVEPLLHRMANQISELEAIMADLRARKDYAASDRLRTVITNMRGAADYAFPRRYAKYTKGAINAMKRET